MSRINAVERARFLEMIDQYADEGASEHKADCGNSRCSGCMKEVLVDAIKRYMQEIESSPSGAN